MRVSYPPCHRFTPEEGRTDGVFGSKDCSASVRRRSKLVKHETIKMEERTSRQILRK